MNNRKRRVVKLLKYENAINVNNVVEIISVTEVSDD